MNLLEISLPVSGMSGASCVAQVEIALKDLPGVDQVVVDLGTAEACIRYDTTRVDTLEFQQAIEEVGYSVPTHELTLAVRGMTCASCVAHVEGALQDLPGVLHATANLRMGTAVVEYIPSLVGHKQMEQALEDGGYRTHLQTDSRPA
jgi:Cu+-exporting ATPase